MTPTGFADDVNLLAYDRSTEVNCITLEKAHEACARWARCHGAAFAPKKYELIYLSRTPRRSNMAATVNLDENAVQPQPDIRVLGVQIDLKLR